MTNSSLPPPHLNFEQQRKRAKDLVRRFRNGDPDAARRVMAHLPRAEGSEPERLLAGSINLAEAQFVVAREAGFESWPRLKQGFAPRGEEDWWRELIEAAIEGHDEKALQLAGERDTRENPWACAALGDSENLFRRLEDQSQLAHSQGGPLSRSLLLYNCDARFGRDLKSIAEARVLIADKLLELGADPNEFFLVLDTDDGKCSALAAAVRSAQNARLVELLLARGADIRDFNAVSAAARMAPRANQDHLACLRALVSEGPPTWHLNGALGITLERDDPDATRFLLDHGADAKTSGGWGGKGSLTHLALWRERSPEVLRLLLEAGASLRVRDRGGKTPLQTAVRLGLQQQADLLRQFGAHPEVVDEKDRLLASCWKRARLAGPPVTSSLDWERTDHEILSWAVASGREHALDNLLVIGLDPAVPDDLGETPLHHVAARNSLEAGKRLIRAGAPLDARNLNGETPLDRALRSPPGKQRRRFVEFLLSKGTATASLLHFPTGDAELDALLRSSGAVEQEDRDARFEMAAEAICSGDSGTLQQLLQEDPDLISARSPRPHRATLLHYVAANGIERQRTPPNAVEITAILLDAGAEPDALCATYGGGPAQTTLALLVSSGWPAQAGLTRPLVQVLCEAGANPNGIDEDGVPMATAIAFRQPDSVDALAHSGARLDNVLFSAAAGDLEILKHQLDDQGLVLPSAANCRVPWLPIPDDPAQAVQQALVHAAQFGRLEVVRFLVELGTEINAGPIDKITPLHEAAFMGHQPVVEFLLEQGADPALREERYSASCLDYARREGHQKVVDLLKS